MSRKFRSGGSTSEQALSRSKKYKYNSSGTLVEATTIADDDIIFSGSKSNLRRMADLERNISILANKILTTDGNATDADDANFNNKFTDDVRFKAETRFDDQMTIKSTMDASAGTVKLSTWQIGGVAVSSSASELNILDGATVSTSELNILDGATLSTTELNYMDGVTSNVQTQINTKAPTANPTFTGTVSGVSASHVGLGNVTNESKATMFASPTFTGTVTAATVTTSGDVTVGGNLTVSGTTTTVNTETINLADNVILVNSNATGTPTENGGIEVERGSSSNVSFVWNEANDQWTTSGQPLRSGHMLPETDVTYDLGSSSLKWRDLYLSGSTIKLGNATISDSGGAISSSGGFSGNATTASAWQTARTLSLTGAVTGSASIDGSGNVSLATTNTADPVITLAGDLSGSATLTNLGSATLTATITKDPTITLTGAVTGSATMTNLGNVSIATTATADPTLTLAGDASGSATFTNLGNATLTVTVADDSHNHSNYITSNANDTASGIYTFSNTTAATSSTTGAVKITGGLGVGGAIYAAGDVTAYSDDRLKTNIHEIENGLDKVMALRGITFERIADGSISTGVSAQDVHAVLPEAVSIDEEGLMAVKYGNLVGLLIEAIKDLKEEVNELKGTGTVH